MLFFHMPTVVQNICQSCVIDYSLLINNYLLIIVYETKSAANVEIFGEFCRKNPHYNINICFTFVINMYWICIAVVLFL